MIASLNHPVLFMHSHYGATLLSACIARPNIWIRANQRHPHMKRMNAPLTRLLASSRLESLRRADPLRDWGSLDDVRTCIVCSRKVTGRRLRIVESPEGPSFRCPTRGCAGTLQDIAMPGNPLLDETVWADWSRSLHHAGAEDSTEVV